MDRKQYLEGYLLAFCDSIDYAVEKEIFDENDMAVKVADYIREYIEEVNQLQSYNTNNWWFYNLENGYRYTPQDITYILCNKCGAIYRKEDGHVCYKYQQDSTGGTK